MTDRSYTYKLQGPPTSWLLKKVLGIQKFTSMPRHKWTNYLSAGYVYEIAKIKQEMDEDLKKQSLESVCKVFFSPNSAAPYNANPRRLWRSAEAWVC
jgi:ribosomal protein L11